MGRKNIWETVMGLDMQDPKDVVVFFAKDIVWSEIHWRNGTVDRVTKIPSESVPHFIKGEEMNPDAPCDFYCNKNKGLGNRDSGALCYEV